MRFRGPYNFLSNFFTLPIQIEHDGYVGDSVESLYQAMKIGNRTVAKLDGKSSLVKGRKQKIVEGWEENKLLTMKLLLDLKFQIPTMRLLLLATGEEEIVEDNYHQDTFWGRYNGRGHNHIGNLLMTIRNEIREGMKVYNGAKLGDLYLHKKDYDFIGFTGNAVPNKQGNLIMGKGSAKRVKELYPSIDKYFGKRVTDDYGIMVNEKKGIFALQTKVNYRKPSSVNIIEKSLDMLFAMCKEHKDKKFAIPAPGIGAGELPIEVALPLLKHKPRNLDIWRLSNNRTCIISDSEVECKHRKRYETVKGLLSEYTIRTSYGLSVEKDIEEGKHEVMLPWNGYSGLTAGTGNGNKVYVPSNRYSKRALSLFRGNPDYSSSSTERLLERYLFVILGIELDQPVDFIMIISSGVKHRKPVFDLINTIANSMCIPVYNLYSDTDYKKIKNVLTK